MDLSIIVVTYNSASCIEACLAAVRRTLPAAELIVVDNGSSDATAAIAKNASARVILNHRNDGFGRACNVGANGAKRAHLLFLNPDVVITRADAAELESLFALEPFGLFGPRAMAADGVIGLQGEQTLFHEWLGQTVGVLRPREWRRPRRRPRRNRKPWLSGSMLLVDRGEFLSIGGFDPRFFLYYEDRDLSARYRGAQLPLRVTPALAGTHLGTASSASDDLRVVPAGWAFLGWIQYLFLHRGERTARATARSGVAALESLRAALNGFALVARTQRIERKRRQLDGLLTFLHTVGHSDDDTFCPDARRILAAGR